MRRIVLGSTVLLALGSLHCSLGDHEATGESTAGVNGVDCQTIRGTFVNASDWPSGAMTVTCANADSVALNGTPVTGSGSYTLQPQFGLNILHVEGSAYTGEKVDLPFFFGSYLAAGTPVPEALSVRVNPTGWVSADGLLHLPLQSGAPLDLSDVGTQILRDQGDLAAQFDGMMQDVSGSISTVFSQVDYSASATVDSLSYDSTNIAVTVVPNATGITLNLYVPSINAQFDWSASALDISLGDTDTVSADALNLSIDVNLAYQPASNGNPGTIVATLGDHHIDVQNLQIGSVDLSEIPLVGSDIEGALSDGMQYLINNFGDQILSSVQGSLIPPIATSIQQFNLPSQVPLPGALGTLNLAETFDQGTFDATGDQLSIGATVSPATPVLQAPGSLAVVNSTSQFDDSPPFGLSVSLDYINQAFYSVWVQGGLSVQVLGPQMIEGTTIDPVVASTKMPLLLLAKQDGSGVSLQQGELEISTTLHHPTLGSFPVTIAANLIADANISLDSTNDSILLSLDPTNTVVTVDLINLPPSLQGAADEITSLINQFLPQALQAASTQLAAPPIPIPTINLGLLSPAFQGRTGTFSGNLVFDGPTQRIYVTGDLITN